MDDLDLEGNQLQSSKYQSVIAIDGPAASGKSTLGYLLAKQLEFMFLDTGCMYRAVTLAALNRDISIEDESEIAALSRQIEIDISSETDFDDSRKYTVFLDGVDVTWDIRLPVVDLNVSQVSAYVEVRKELVRQQRLLACKGRIVAVGRDIGTVVLPESPVKIYLIASPEERAKRRWLEQRMGENTMSYEEILADLRRRDGFDGGRRYSPMKPAVDSIIIDTTGLTTREVLAQMLAIPQIAEMARP